MLAGCAAVPPPVASAPPPPERLAAAPAPVLTPLETGKASIYGRRFNGRRTASGSRLNLAANTAAHRSLPFGTKLRVTNLATGLSTDVTVQDRGPFVRGRILDLTSSAAEELGMLQQGVANVSVDVVEVAEAPQ